MKYTVLIVGLGSIGFLYDINNKIGTVLTHAKSFDLDPRFELIGGVDINTQIRMNFENIYKKNSWSTIKEAIKIKNPDVIVISTPTNDHFKTFKEIFQYVQPKCILIEKPISYKVSETKNIIEVLNKNNCKGYVNFFRSSLPSTQKIKRMVRNNIIGKPIKGYLWYSKGIFNTGSHFIDLFRIFFGEVLEIRILKKNQIKDFDVNPDLYLKFRDASIYFIASNTDKFFYNQFELFGQRGKLVYKNGGAEILWHSIKKDKLFQINKIISDNPKFFETDFKNIQSYVVSELFKALCEKKSNLVSVEESLPTHLILEKIICNYER